MTQPLTASPQTEESLQNSQQPSQEANDNFWALPPGAVNVSQANLYPETSVTPDETEEVATEELEAAEEQPAATSEADPEINVEELLAALPEEDTPEASVDTTDFDNQFKARFGITPEEAQTVVQQFQDFQQRSQVHEQKLSLAATWGIPYDQVGLRLEAVKKVWDKLPSDAQSKLDNLDGAVTLWAYLEGKKTSQPSLVTAKSRASTPKPYDFTLSEIKRMGSQEYNARNAEITKAFNTGRVALNK
jgi:uncharacterized tellurite resistance protein B-like protein